MNAQNLPDLEARFLPPPNWHGGKFQNPETGHRIHFQHSAPAQHVKGNVIALPGLSEFSEKYYETAQFFIKHGYGFAVIDWAYQGKSSRFNENSHKRYSDGYDTDLSDLKYFIDHYIDIDAPLFLLGHSMGGHIGLRFLMQQPDYFQAASFSAPMIGIKDLKYTSWLIRLLNPFFRLVKTSYIPGGKNWNEGSRKSDGADIFSSDPARGSLHNAWCLHNPTLQVGNATIKWVLESLASSKILKSNLGKINIPTLLAIAGQEKLVDNSQIKKAGQKIMQSKILVLPKAKHEILVETDDIHNEFLEETLKLFTEST